MHVPAQSLATRQPEAGDDCDIRKILVERSTLLPPPTHGTPLQKADLCVVKRDIEPPRDLME
ncbi:hypothetical protein D3C81_1403230 [compost metagenome]